MSILALILAVLGLGFLILLWVSIFLSVGLIAWKGTIGKLARLPQ